MALCSYLQEYLYIRYLERDKCYYFQGKRWILFDPAVQRIKRIKRSLRSKTPSPAFVLHRGLSWETVHHRYHTMVKKSIFYVWAPGAFRFRFRNHYSHARGNITHLKPNRHEKSSIICRCLSKLSSSKAGSLRFQKASSNIW